MNKFVDFTKRRFFRQKFYILLTIVFLTFISPSCQKPNGYAGVLIKEENMVGNRYSIKLEPMTVTGFNGLHSFAVAQHNEKWLLIGGRTDGLHRPRPFEAFPESQNNKQILVIDPEAKKIWSADLATLPVSISEQLQSTNMQFIQRDENLFLIGGYGYSRTSRDHITHDKLTTVNVRGLIKAITEGKTIKPYIKQISDPIFALTGGQLLRIDDTYYLVGGHRFDGLYNPMGPDHGPGFEQEYSDQIIKFKVIEKNSELKIEKLLAIKDKTNLHRRDFNMLPQIFSDKSRGFTIFSGVFRRDANLPFINTVEILKDKITVNNSFKQHLNHYHSAKVALYDSKTEKMENLFFGGISLFEEKEKGKFVENQDVPFTKAIGKVVRHRDGKMTETKIAEMPGFLGAGAEFIINKKNPHFESEIIKLSEIKGKRVLLGYIVGGIESKEKAIFFNFRERGLSSASKKIFKVWLDKTKN